MITANQQLLIEQLDRKLEPFKVLASATVPEKGWIHSIRSALNMSLRQLGARLNVSPQSIKELETREASGSLTLKTLREAGAALNMKLVYGFVPMEGSISKMIGNRARELALEIITRTSHSMKLEDQENREERLSIALDLKAKEIIDTLPRHLWD